MKTATKRRRPVDGGEPLVAWLLHTAAVLSGIVAAVLVLQIVQNGFGLWRAAGAAFFCYFTFQARWNADLLSDIPAAAHEQVHHDKV